MDFSFLIIAALTAGGALAAFCLRNLVHSVLALVVSFAGFAMLYIRLGAEFVGFAQILVYIGAVAILIVFAILLTRGGEVSSQTVLAPSWWIGAGVAVFMFGALTTVFLTSPAMQQEVPPEPEATVKGIGDVLMTKYVLPLEVVGLLLTAALIGAVLIAKPDKEAEK